MAVRVQGILGGGLSDVGRDAFMVRSSSDVVVRDTGAYNFESRY